MMICSQIDFRSNTPLSALSSVSSTLWSLDFRKESSSAGAANRPRSFDLRGGALVLAGTVVTPSACISSIAWSLPPWSKQASRQSHHIMDRIGKRVQYDASARSVNERNGYTHPVSPFLSHPPLEKNKIRVSRLACVIRVMYPPEMFFDSTSDIFVQYSAIHRRHR